MTAHLEPDRLASYFPCERNFPDHLRHLLQQLKPLVQEKNLELLYLPSFSFPELFYEAEKTDHLIQALLKHLFVYSPEEGRIAVELKLILHREPKEVEIQVKEIRFHSFGFTLNIPVIAVPNTGNGDEREPPDHMAVNLHSNPSLSRPEPISPGKKELMKALSFSQRIFFRRLNQYLEKHFQNDQLGPEDLSKAFSLHRVSLNRKVKNITGLSTSKYITSFRLEKSKRLLNDHPSVKEVAFAVGFSSLEYFSRCFKKSFGISPSEFRQGA